MLRVTFFFEEENTKSWASVNGLVNGQTLQRPHGNHVIISRRKYK